MRTSRSFASSSRSSQVSSSKVTSLFAICSFHSSAVFPTKGTSPHMSWYIVMPIPHTSAGSPAPVIAMTSGAM
eukprot:CAMPEP_0204356892 /NCGR_PEP_ID=MMETSP0469-20131031/35295_1 /ASSEMBLY_ACC=CAM_ASM_000384 /TAXON_ID=2969 /ORGANISM="Oxyrrhis marina" /LENGTH=72 /DNA_ID=CAMNT_0051344433 /DNA_START=313 /DNA_END=531 /DNA_ORIENTATION=+